MSCSRIVVVSGMDPGYAPRAAAYRFLESLGSMTGVERRFILIDFDDGGAAGLERAHPGIGFVRMKTSEMQSPNPVKCCQQGDFLEKSGELGLMPDDYVIFTDADITVRRNFTPQETEQLLAGRVLAASNWHDGETLLDELPALSPTVPGFVVAAYHPGFEAVACLNTGVLGMPVGDWIRLRRLFKFHWPLVDRSMNHYAKIQWLICYLLGTQGFELHDPTSELVRGAHFHHHEPNLAQRFNEQRFFSRTTPVVFDHHYLP